MEKKAISLQQLEAALRDMGRWIREKLAGYIKEPAAEGGAGYVLTTNGAGGRSWARVKNEGGLSDVRINGSSVVDENGVAEIPYASGSAYGLVRTGSAENGEISVETTDGRQILRYPVAGAAGLKGRKAQGSQYGGTVDASNFDAAVKAAMTDGIGAAWTADEQTAARARMGAVSLADVLNATAMVKLWENASWSSGFAGQTIAVDLSGYDFYMVTAVASTTSQYVISTIVPAGNGGLLSYAWGDSGAAVHRSFVRVTNGIQFYGAYFNKNGSTEHIMPFQIYGIKGVK